MASEVGAKPGGTSQQLGELIAEHKQVTSWADEVEEADDGSLVTPLTLAKSSSKPPQPPAAWSDGPPYSVCISGVPAGLPFEDVAGLFRGSYIISIRHRPMPEAPYVLVDFNDQRDALAALAAGAEQQLSLQGRRLDASPVSYQTAAPVRPGYPEAPAPYVNGGSAPYYQQPQQRPYEESRTSSYGSRDSYPGPPPRPGGTASSSSYTTASVPRTGAGEWLSGSSAYHGSSAHTSPERWRLGSISSSNATAGPSETAGAAAATAPQPAAGRPAKRLDPFGGAKPVDTAAVYIDGHPHHTEIAAAKLGPAAAAPAAQSPRALAPEYMVQPQQQQQHPIKLLQRPPQPAARPDSRGESLAGGEISSEAGRGYAQQQQQQQLPPIPRQQPTPPYGHYPPHMQQQQQQPLHGSPFGSPGKHPSVAAAHPSGVPIGSSSSTSTVMYQPPDPHYTLPPPPPPPPRPVPEGTPAPAAPPAVAGVWASGAPSAAAAAAAGLGGPPPPPPAAAAGSSAAGSAAAAAAPSLQGAWAVRGGTGAPVIGYKALGSSRPGSSGPASGPGSRRGSFSALTDDAVQLEQPQPQQQLSRFYGQQQQQQMDSGYQHMHQYMQQQHQQQQQVAESAAPAAVVAAKPAAVADDWGVVEEFISQQPRDYSILQPDKDLPQHEQQQQQEVPQQAAPGDHDRYEPPSQIYQIPAGSGSPRTQQQQQLLPAASGMSEGAWGSGVSTSQVSPAAQQASSDNWGTAAAAAAGGEGAEFADEGLATAQQNADSRGAEASDAASAGAGDAASNDKSSAAGAVADRGDNGRSSGREFTDRSRGRGGRRGRGGPQHYEHEYQYVEEQGYYAGGPGAYRGRGRGRGRFSNQYDALHPQPQYPHPAAAGPRYEQQDNGQQQQSFGGRGGRGGGQFLGAGGLGVPASGPRPKRGMHLVHEQQQQQQVAAEAEVQQQQQPGLPAAAAAGRGPPLRRSSSNVSTGRAGGKGDRLPRRMSQEVTLEWVPKGSSAAAAAAGQQGSTSTTNAATGQDAANGNSSSNAAQAGPVLVPSHSGIDAREAADAVAAASAAVADILAPMTRSASSSSKGRAGGRGQLAGSGKGVPPPPPPPPPPPATAAAAEQQQQPAQQQAVADAGNAELESSATGTVPATSGIAAAATGPQQHAAHTVGSVGGRGESSRGPVDRAGSGRGDGPRGRGRGARGRGRCDTYNAYSVSNGPVAAAAAPNDAGEADSAAAGRGYGHGAPRGGAAAAGASRGRGRGGRGRGRSEAYDRAAAAAAGSSTEQGAAATSRLEADAGSEVTESDEISVVIHPRVHVESSGGDAATAAADRIPAAAGGGRGDRGGYRGGFRGRGRPGPPADKRSSSDGHSASAGGAEEYQDDGGRGGVRGRGRGRGRSGRSDTDKPAAAAREDGTAAAAAGGGSGPGGKGSRGEKHLDAPANGNSKQPASKASAAAKQQTQQQQTQQGKKADKAGSVGQKLYKEITAKQKEIAKGPKLDNPFALLELDAE